MHRRELENVQLREERTTPYTIAQTLEFYQRGTASHWPYTDASNARNRPNFHIVTGQSFLCHQGLHYVRINRCLFLNLGL